MEVVFTYLPIRLKEATEIYLKYSIEKLNEQNITPLLYSDVDYLQDANLKYRLIKFQIDEKYKKNSLWSYPKLKVLSMINFPFIHLDNDLVVDDFSKLNNIIEGNRLNLGYKHPLTKIQIDNFTQIYKRYSNSSSLNFNQLNNTCIIATNDYIRINAAYSDVLKIIDLNYDFFIKRYNDVPPITLNQQYLNLYFDDINYLFGENPSFKDLKRNGVCHIAEKDMVSNFVKNKILI